MRRPAGDARDDGSATVWAATGIAVVMGALLIAMHVGSAIVARHRAEAAADLAALAAATHAVHGTGAACAKAGEIADAMGGLVASCALSGWDALVEVHVAVPLALPGTGPARGRARAGPVPEPELALDHGGRAADRTAHHPIGQMPRSVRRFGPRPPRSSSALYRSATLTGGRGGRTRLLVVGSRPQRTQRQRTPP